MLQQKEPQTEQKQLYKVCEEHSLLVESGKTCPICLREESLNRSNLFFIFRIDVREKSNPLRETPKPNQPLEGLRTYFRFRVSPSQPSSHRYHYHYVYYTIFLSYI